MLHNLTAIISKVGDDLDIAHLGSVMAKCLTDFTELFKFYFHQKKIHDGKFTDPETFALIER